MVLAKNKDERYETTGGGKVEDKKEDVDDKTKLEIVERMEKANEEAKELLRKKEEMEEKEAMGGVAVAGQIQGKPRELTPKEYSEKVMRGEINPLKEDGFI